MLSPSQRAALATIADTFFPPLPLPDGITGVDAKKFYETGAGSLPLLLDALETTIDDVLEWQERVELKAMLTIIGTAVGSAALFPVSPFTVAFVDRTLEQRTAALRSLATSILPPRRKAFNGLKRLILGLTASFVDEDQKVAAELNPFWKAIGYSGPPRLAMDPADDADLVAEAKASGADFRKAALPIDGDREVEFDVVVVGSGAGGGVAAATLSAQGYSVLVLEKAVYYAPEEMTQIECNAMKNMYEKSALLTSDDGSVSILAGATFGGGTSINWACCLDLPRYVRAEWATELGLDQFDPTAAAHSDFNRAEATVKKRIGASTAGVGHNPCNQLLMDGSAKLGYVCDVTGQNFQDTEADTAGWSCFGDRYGNKQGTARTYHADAASNGAKFVHECSVDSITHEPTHDGRRTATGLTARVGKDGHRLVVKARRCVVVAAGSLNSPCVLLRSGFEGEHIGKHLRLHPVTGAYARHAGKNLDMWVGAPMTTVCREAESGPKNDGYGAKIEVPSVHTGLIAATLPWMSGARYKRLAMTVRESIALIVLQRDHDSEGTIRLGPDGFSPKVDYIVGEADKQSMVAALQTALRVLAAEGPTMLATLHSWDTQFDNDGTKYTGKDTKTDREIEAYLDRVAELGLGVNEVGMFSAHQMGSNRMGVDPAASVVDADGEMWECDGVYICDASVFPTASGANPMMSTLSIATMISTRLVERLQLQDGKLEPGTDTHGRALADKERRAARRQNITVPKKSRAALQLCFAAAAAALVLWTWYSTVDPAHE